jgi:chemotaxis protein CheC
VTTLTEPQRDALRELANVGAGHAATALSRLLAGERLAFLPPEAWTGAAGQVSERLREASAPWVAAVQAVRGDCVGALWLAFGQPDAQAFAARLLGEARPDALRVEAAVAQAAREAGASALSAMGHLTGLAFEAGEPVLRRGPAAALESASGDSTVLVLEVRLRAEGFTAEFLFVPEATSLGALLRSLRV